MSPEEATNSPLDGEFGVVPVAPAVDETVNLAMSAEPDLAGFDSATTRLSAGPFLSPNKTRHATRNPLEDRPV
jgi:hypothetical protein